MTSSGIVADIKSRLPIVELVGETVALKRAGSAYKGLCPFHTEKTPSFIVTPDRESWHCFGCGKGGDAFPFLMERDGVDFREALTGLAGPSNRGGIIDKFRGRIIIPIRDQSGKAVGLGGRILPGLEGPKYLNSPSTPLFDKSRTLFAIDLAKSSIRKEKLSVIVEGYTDVMAAHQAGFTNVVASLGTALTRGPVELATRYADAVALAYDVDLAGEAATQRGLLEELGPDAAVSKVRVIRIPAGKDPD